MVSDVGVEESKGCGCWADGAKRGGDEVQNDELDLPQLNGGRGVRLLEILVSISNPIVCFFYGVLMCQA